MKRIAVLGLLSAAGAFALTACSGAPAAEEVPVQGAPQVPACADGQVNFNAEPMMNSAGTTVGFKISYWVVGASGACSLQGFPGVTAVGGGPQVDAVRGDEVPTTVVLDREHGAQAVIETTVIAHQGSACPTYTEFLTTPPNTTDTRSVSVTVPGCEFAVYPVYAWSR
ncbi:DUF4232 domain-containing protein [Nocardia sp. NPDC050697]|uniref:DUF4232 domain-containing protein n=1 Tax=Nocardia sp. NPDC050697 TaxID=3155158 RepID=UPI0033F7760C